MQLRMPDCQRRSKIVPESLYYSWSKEFAEAGKRRLSGDAARATTSGEIKDLRRRAQELKKVVAEQALEFRLLRKKHDRGWGRRVMRYPGSERLEIIRLVERSHLADTRHPAFNILSMIRSLSDRRPGGPGAAVQPE
jgi:transposase-like protein